MGAEKRSNRKKYVPQSSPPVGAVSRRTLVGSAAVAAVAPRSSLARAKDPLPEDANVLATPVVVREVLSDRQLVLSTLDGTVITTKDPRPRESWKVGDEAVLEQKLVAGRWVVHNLVRMYRFVLDERVLARHDNVLITNSAQPPIELNKESNPRADGTGRYVAQQLDSIQSGDFVTGTTYHDPTTGQRIAAGIGVRHAQSGGRP